MKPASFTPSPSLVEEWDNPAMAEFKRQEAEDRVDFGTSAEAREWLEHLKNSQPSEPKIRLAPKRPQNFPFKRIRLPW